MNAKCTPNPAPLTFEGLTVRTVLIDGEPWFVGKDVADALGYARSSDAMQQHCKGAVKRHPLQTAGGVQELRVLAEADVLRLILGSHLPAAERFERWVFEDVLPTIRRTGAYGTPALLNLRDPKQMAAVAVQLLEVNQELQAQLTAAAPKIAFAEAVGDAENLQKPVEVANVLQIGLKTFYATLRARGVLQHDNRPFQRHIDAGRFRMVELPYTDRSTGEKRVKATLRVTGRGVTYLQQLLAKQPAPEGVPA